MEADLEMSTTEIPFELIDDEEMAAIDAAFLNAYSVSSAHHSADAKSSSTWTLGSVASCAQSRIECDTNHMDHGLEVSMRRCSGKRLSLSARNRGSVIFSLQEEEEACSSVSFESSVRLSQETKNVDSGNTDIELSQSSRNNSYLSYGIPHDLATQVGEVSEQKAQLELTGELIAGSLRSLIRTTSSDPRETLPSPGIPALAHDIEDLGTSVAATVTGSNVLVPDGFFPQVRHRSRSGVCVTDVTAAEWCEKQVEFSVTLGKPKRTLAMKAGSARHVELEVEVVTRVEVEIHTREDSWAVRLLNVISGARQLLSEGMTRELPVAGVLADTWVTGVIDEIYLVEGGGLHLCKLVDTKTRMRRTPPPEAQKRNARLQLMIYKMLWDSMIQNGLSSQLLFENFKLQPQRGLSQDVISHAADLFDGSEVHSLRDLMPMVNEELRLFPLSTDVLLLRYEWQGDRSLLGVDEFEFEHEWATDRLKWHMQFWKGHRKAALVPEGEDWKCRRCSFVKECKEYQGGTNV